MPRPASCPPELAHRVFRGSDAIARGVLTPGNLRSSVWRRLFEDVYVHREHAAQDWARHEALLLVTDEGHVACGRTAAWLHGVWTPPPGVSVPIEISRPKRTHGHPVRGHDRRRLTLRDADELPASEGDVVKAGGVLATSAMRTCFDLMRDRRLVEAVVVGDAFLHAGAVDPLALAVYCQERCRWPGVRQARLAAGLASPFARSSGESRLRMVLVLAGFVEPLVNVPVVDGLDRHVATPDLQVKGRQWAWLEYDGAYHEDAGQHAADVRRENRLAVTSGGIPVLRYDRTHLATGAGRLRIVHEVATATRFGRPLELDQRDFIRPPATRTW